MMKILIVEDEPFIAEDIQERLEQLGFGVTGIADSYESACEELEKELPDLVLLDIELRGTLNGIDFGKRLSEMGIKHMYLTGTQDNITFMRARETTPLLNIPKPITTVSLRNALDIDLLKTPSSTPLLLRMISDGEKKRRIDLNDIIYLEAEGSYCDIHLKDGKLTQTMNLKASLKYLDWVDIIRVGKTYAVNMHYIKNKLGNRLELNNGVWIDIEPRYRPNIQKRLK